MKNSTETWYRHLRFIDWIVVIIFILPGSYILSSAIISTFLSDEFEFSGLLLPLIFGIAIIFIAVFYITLAWFSYTSIAVFFIGEITPTEKIRHIIDSAKQLYIFPLLFILGLTASGYIFWPIPNIYSIAAVLLILFPFLIISISMLAGLGMHSWKKDNRGQTTIK